MTVARIRFGEHAQGRDLRQDVADFMQWLEAECGESAAEIGFSDPADPVDRATGAADADGARLTVRVKDC